MSTRFKKNSAPGTSPPALETETLATGVVIMLVMTVAQRLIGFSRGVLFCRWLPTEQLGEWDMSVAFLNLAAPLAVLGLPGSFGRYVEYFRARGQFHTFLRRTTIATALTALAATALIVVNRTWFSRLIFGTDRQSDVVVWLAVSLAAIILHDFLTALFTAVRMYRVATILQFLQSLGFAVFSLALLAIWSSRATSAVIGFTLATVLATLASVGWLSRLTAADVGAAAPLAQRSFWGKLMPFAIWMWLTNLVANLFDLIDRYMIMHHSGMTASEALRQVGNYHTSRIVPLLFVAVAALLAALITPHLTHDWELGRRRNVVRRLNLILKLLALVLMATSIVVLFCAPWLFGVAFQNKYQSGLAVLPCTLTYGAWFGVYAVAVTYLWCAERPGLASLPLVLGLFLNVALNALLLPRFGLPGAVWSTTVANLAALAMALQFCRAMGMRIDRGTWTTSLAIATLCLGPWIALAAFALIVRAALLDDRVFTRQEKREFAESLALAARSIREFRRQLNTPTTVASE